MIYYTLAALMLPGLFKLQGDYFIITGNILSLHQVFRVLIYIQIIFSI